MTFGSIIKYLVELNSIVYSFSSNRKTFPVIHKSSANIFVICSSKTLFL